ncbi:uncharacterized protein [Lepeophtheirus salmonis]|uniref:uncharacterized protein n=1 Tax=Lepeophtheirus salmonis TaxID=72036 RepID=UPI001AEA0988|nr:zinc finger protein 585A-like [Lepeophtheirus salmonis]
MKNENSRGNMSGTTDLESVLSKVKEWIEILSGTLKAGIVLQETNKKDSIHLALYPNESNFLFLPSFHIVFLPQSNGTVELQLLAYNETLLVQETLQNKKGLDLNSSEILDLISQPYVRLCSGVISQGEDQDLIIETISSKKVFRSSNCSYILTKKNDLCCFQCIHLNSSVNSDPLINYQSEDEGPGECNDDFSDPDYEEPKKTPTKLKKRKRSRVDSTSKDSDVEPPVKKSGRPKTALRCDVCYSIFYYKGHYKTHLATHENVKSILEESCSCPICSTIIESKSDLNVHIKDIHPEKKNELCCFLCFKFVKNLSKHLNSTHDHRTVVCSKCGKTVRQRYYGEHLTLAHGAKEDRRVVCPVCGKILCRKSNLAIHIKVMHSDESERILACEICGKNVSTHESPQKTF